MTPSSQLSEINLSERHPNSVSLTTLAEELKKVGLNVQENDIVQTPDSKIETSEMKNDFKEIVNSILNTGKHPKYDPNKTALNAPMRALIRYRLGGH